MSPPPTFCSIISPRAGRASIRTSIGPLAQDEGVVCIGHKRGSSVQTDAASGLGSTLDQGRCVVTVGSRGRRRVGARSPVCVGCNGLYSILIQLRRVYERETHPDTSLGPDVRTLGLPFLLMYCILESKNQSDCVDPERMCA
jgi:hypothetical protein